jgi:nucleoside-diphosphate-sugar epimerase
LEETFNISKQDIPRKIRAFAEALETTFGNGARLLEIEMMRSLYKRVHRSFEYSSEDDLTFAAYVEAVRRALRSQTMSAHALYGRLSKFL